MRRFLITYSMRHISSLEIASTKIRLQDIQNGRIYAEIKSRDEIKAGRKYIAIPSHQLSSQRLVVATVEIKEDK